MPIGDKTYLSEQDGANATMVNGTNTLIHTFADDNPQEVWLYASAPADTTVTLTSPRGTTVDFDILANTETALLKGQVVKRSPDILPDIVSDFPFADLFAVTVESDDSVWVGGSIKHDPSGYSWGNVAHFYANNDLDTSFNLTMDGDGYVYSVGVRSDNKIVAGGEIFNIYGQSYQSWDHIVLLYPNGDVDTSFFPNINDTIKSVAIQSDDKCVLGGYFTSAGVYTANGIVRLHPNGGVDSSFAIPNLNNVLEEVEIQSDGKILVSGWFSSVGATTMNKVARLHANGALDTSFADPNVNNVVYSMDIQSDGKIIIGGNFTSVGGVTRDRVARLHPNGDIDTTFADPGCSNEAYVVKAQSDGKIVVGGSFTAVGGEYHSRIARLYANGAVDSSFDTSVDNHVRDLGLRSDGQIVVGGSYSSVDDVDREGYALLDSDGSLSTEIKSDFYANSTAEVWIRGYTRTHI